MSKKSELAYRGLDDHRWSGFLIVGGSTVYYYGPVSPVERPHKIGALEIIIAIDGDILVRTNDAFDWKVCKAVAINPNQQRQLDVSHIEKCLFGFSIIFSLDKSTFVLSGCL